MYGGTAEGVDLILHYYHELWAEIKDEQQKHETVLRKILKEQECGAATFSTRYRLNYPNYSESEIASYAVTQWKKISKRFGVPVMNEKKQRHYSG